MAEFPLPILQIWRSRKRVAFQIQLMNIHVSECKYYCLHLVSKFDDGCDGCVLPLMCFELSADDHDRQYSIILFETLFLFSCKCRIWVDNYVIWSDTSRCYLVFDVTSPCPSSDTSCSIFFFLSVKFYFTKLWYFIKVVFQYNDYLIISVPINALFFSIACRVTSHKL